MYKYTGIDLLKETFDASITTNTGGVSKKLSNNVQGFNKLLALLPTNAQVVMEAYMGLKPSLFESNTSVKGKGHISKMGTARLRKLLYLCAWSAKRYNQQCQQMYERLKAKAKPEKVIKVAIANKLLQQAFAIGKNLKNYRTNHASTLAF